jgi:hypothetical protein
MWPLRAIAVCGLTVASVAGCGGPKLVPVEGTVALDGKPLAGATIALELVGGEKGFRLFSGETDSSGRYVIKPFETRRVGALPGEYHVIIKSVKFPPDANEMTVLPKDPVPVEFQNGSKMLTVPEDGIENADFKMSTR